MNKHIFRGILYIFTIIFILVISKATGGVLDDIAIYLAYTIPTCMLASWYFEDWRERKKKTKELK